MQMLPTRHDQNPNGPHNYSTIKLLFKKTWKGKKNEVWYGIVVFYLMGMRREGRGSPKIPLTHTQALGFSLYFHLYGSKSHLGHLITSDIHTDLSTSSRATMSPFFKALIANISFVLLYSVNRTWNTRQYSNPFSRGFMSQTLSLSLYIHTISFQTLYKLTSMLIEYTRSSIKF